MKKLICCFLVPMLLLQSLFLISLQAIPVIPILTCSFAPQAVKRFTFRKAPSPKTTLITIFTTVFPTKHMMSIVRIPMSFYVLEHPLSRLNGVFAPPPDQSVFLLFQKGGGALHSAAFSRRPAQEQNRCLPITVNRGRDQIHLLVAVAGLK